MLCTRESRAELLRGISDELGVLPEEKSDSFEKLKTYYGKPENTASILQDAVAPAERAFAIRSKKRMTLAAFTVVSVFIVMLFVLVFFLLKNMTTIGVTFPPNTPGFDALPSEFYIR